MSFIRVLMGTAGVHTSIDDVIPASGPQLVLDPMAPPKNDTERFLALDKHSELLKLSIVDTTRSRWSAASTWVAGIPVWLKWVLGILASLLFILVIAPYFMIAYKAILDRKHMTGGSELLAITIFFIVLYVLHMFFV